MGTRGLSGLLDGSVRAHLAAAGGHANRSSQTPPVATTSGPPHLRPPWARMPQVRPLARGDHAMACHGLVARRAKLVEQAWLAVCREAVGAEGHVVPRQWLSHTSAPGVPTSDRRRLDLVVYGASPQGLALCCDATLVSPITGANAPHPRADHTPGIALRMAASRKRATYPELQRGGGQRLFVLAVEVGGRWNADSQALVRQFVWVRALRAPPPLRAAASSAWTRRWWGTLSTAVQHAVGGTALRTEWLVSKGAAGCAPALDHVLALAEPAPAALSVGLAHHVGPHHRHLTPHSRSFFLEKKKKAFVLSLHGRKSGGLGLLAANFCSIALDTPSMVNSPPLRTAYFDIVWPNDSFLYDHTLEGSTGEPAHSRKACSLDFALKSFCSGRLVKCTESIANLRALASRSCCCQRFS